MMIGFGLIRAFQADCYCELIAVDVRENENETKIKGIEQHQRERARWYRSGKESAVL